MNTSSARGPATAGSQTLSRGLQALELLGEAEAPLTINELAEGLGIHRSNAYRILRTLEQRRFVARDEAGRIRLGPKLTALARGVAPALHTAATPAITELAYRLGMTAFLTVLDIDEVVTLITVEPSNATAIARNPGVRHPVERGAPGHAMEASLSAVERERLLGSPEFGEAALAAKRDGYALSRHEVVEGVMGVAVPLRIPGEPPAAVAVVHFSLPESLDDIVGALQGAAREIAQNYA
ncbi:IclR family transcriptional regulator [Leucobacter sp. UCD-THU]|jgi:DNA-binding IclR family transcriptional regulator|uniref:IclR family transcriptional regulator n=1 Tax=Leucobacter muris TaxID=1935379 RepID=A0ABX5QGK5_9MICO|nr:MULTISPECIES: IclR family transcriptional regulator [Leucobacter]EYT56105.1 IclR family transcriptional regulator [Leucobacter sp. UCD-THU]QAB18202.1 IclR family transcriptional regulator [Leucobacter muris]